MSNTTAPSANDLLMGGGGKSAKFPEVGSKVMGEITDLTVTQQTDIDGKPKTWDDGKPMWQVVATLQTTDREDGDDDGLRKLYIKGSTKNPVSMAGAVRKAVTDAGEKEMKVGGQLAVVYTGDGEATRAGLNAPKEYKAQYKAPVATVAVDGDFFGDGAA